MWSTMLMHTHNIFTGYVISRVQWIRGSILDSQLREPRFEAFESVGKFFHSILVQFTQLKLVIGSGELYEQHSWSNFREAEMVSD